MSNQKWLELFVDWSFRPSPRDCFYNPYTEQQQVHWYQSSTCCDAEQHGQAQWNWILTHNLHQCKHGDILAKYLIIPALVLQLTNLLAQGNLKIHVLLLQATGGVKKSVWTEKRHSGSLRTWAKAARSWSFGHLIASQVSSTLRTVWAGSATAWGNSAPLPSILFQFLCHSLTCPGAGADPTQWDTRDVTGWNETEGDGALKRRVKISFNYINFSQSILHHRTFLLQE